MLLLLLVLLIELLLLLLILVEILTSLLVLRLVRLLTIIALLVIVEVASTNSTLGSHSAGTHTVSAIQLLRHRSLLQLLRVKLVCSVAVSLVITTSTVKGLRGAPIRCHHEADPSSSGSCRGSWSCLIVIGLFCRAACHLFVNSFPHLVGVY